MVRVNLCTTLVPRGASASVGALFVVSFPLGEASGKDDGEQPKWTTTSSMFQTG
jgi:hypothetical protein